MVSVKTVLFCHTMAYDGVDSITLSKWPKPRSHHRREEEAKPSHDVVVQARGGKRTNIFASFWKGLKLLAIDAETFASLNLAQLGDRLISRDQFAKRGGNVALSESRFIRRGAKQRRVAPPRIQESARCGVIWINPLLFASNFSTALVHEGYRAPPTDYGV